jgi:hypothetical protein
VGVGREGVGDMDKEKKIEEWNKKLGNGDAYVDIRGDAKGKHVWVVLDGGFDLKALRMIVKALEDIEKAG